MISSAFSLASCSMNFFMCLIWEREGEGGGIRVQLVIKPNKLRSTQYPNLYEHLHFNKVGCLVIATRSIS